MKNELITNAIRSEETYIKERMLDWKFTKEVAKTILGYLLPAESVVSVGSGSITIRVPWGLENLQLARKAIGSGWEVGGSYTASDGTITKTYYRYQQNPYPQANRSVYLNLVMDATQLDPDSCKRIEIGEKTFTQKVYQVVCNDEIKEVLGKAEEMA